MSYDINYRVSKCPNCGQYPNLEAAGWPYGGLSPTFNVSRIFYKALEAAGLSSREIDRGDGEFESVHGLHGLHGLSGRQATRFLNSAIAWCHNPANREMIQELEPDNGWGDVSTVTSTFSKLMRVSEEFPDGVIDTCYGAGL